jgi:hypothetical protein
MYFLQVLVKHTIKKVSNIFKGEQMVPVLNKLEVDVACVGNHDFVIINSVNLGLRHRSASTFNGILQSQISMVIKQSISLGWLYTASRC